MKCVSKNYHSCLPVTNVVYSLVAPEHAPFGLVPLYHRWKSSLWPPTTAHKNRQKSQRKPLVLKTPSRCRYSNSNQFLFRTPSLLLCTGAESWREECKHNHLPLGLLHSCLQLPGAFLEAQVVLEQGTELLLSCFVGLQDFQHIFCKHKKGLFFEKPICLSLVEKRLVTSGESGSSCFRIFALKL